MFKFLSLLKRNGDEQLNDNDYDFNEVPLPTDVQGVPESRTSVLVDNAIDGKPKDFVQPTPPPDTTRADQKKWIK